jgi:hypothetical protein
MDSTTRILGRLAIVAILVTIKFIVLVAARH